MDMGLPAPSFPPEEEQPWPKIHDLPSIRRTLHHSLASKWSDFFGASSVSNLQSPEEVD
jgi:hypothetical protein